ncbi:acylphosphatase [Candidatus Parcubacteria bacterium]|nr:acylphosphatase [Candidatus Parcubacteria bacterium]
MRKRIHLLISGSVQGVLYRVNSKSKAEELDLTGYVRNMSDSKVEILAEGEENNLKEFIKWCYNGPDNAVVSEVKVKWSEYEEKFDKFEILV